MFRRKRPASDYNAALLGLCHVADGAARGGPRLLLIPLRKWSVILCSSMHSTDACWCYGRCGRMVQGYKLPARPGGTFDWMPNRSSSYRL